MTIPKASDEVPPSQPKLTCVNCGDNLGDSSRVVHAFQSFINNAPARIFVKAAIQVIYRLSDRADFEFQDDCVLCVHCCLLLSQTFGLFRLFEARQNPEGLLASCCSGFRNGAKEGNAGLMEVCVTKDEAFDGERLSQVSFHRVDSADDDNFEDSQSSEGMEENADQISLAPDSPPAPAHPNDNEDDHSKSEVEDEEGSENKKAEVLPLKNVEQREFIISKICPDGKQLIFQCADCSEHFKQAVQLRTHRLSAHDSREAYKCAVCENLCPSETIFRRHLFEHLKVTKSKPGIKCSLCDRWFPNRHTLVKHKSLMHSSGLKKKLKKSMKASKEDESTMCEICDESFDNIFLLKEHRLVVHLRAQQPTLRDDPEVQSGLELEVDVHIENNENENKDGEADVQELVDPDYTPNADHRSSESGSEEEEEDEEEEDDDDADDDDDDDTDDDDDEEDVDKASKRQSKNLRPSGPDKLPLTCGDCHDKQYKKRESFVYHRKTQHPGNPIYQCYICQLIFQGGGRLLRHVVEQHTSDSQSQPQVTFKCTDCNLTYHAVSAFGKHRKEDHGDVEIPFKCHLCPVAFKRPQGLRNHMLFRHSGALVPECKDCDKTFCSYRGLRLHMKQTHHVALMTGVNCTIPDTYDKMMFMCVKCNNEEFPNEDAYLEHNKNAHSQEIFKCPECLKIYASENWFNRHLESHKKSPYACDICEATFPNAWDLRRHMTYEHTEQPTVAPVEDPPSTQDKNEKDNIEFSQDPTTKLFSCPQCSLQFDTKIACSFHLREVHPELMKFECEICNKKFRTMEHLKAHRKQFHHTVKCEYCDFVSSISSVRYHCKNAHRLLIEKRKLSKLQAQYRMNAGKEVIKLAIRKYHVFKCADCDEAYKVIGKLMIHRAVAHPDQEKLKCPHCFNVSLALVHLKRHMMSHDESKDWPCGECSLRFTLKLTRNKHLKEVHGVHKTKDDALPLPPESALKHLSGEVSKTEKPLATGTNAFKCPECDEEFNWASNLGNHRVIVHGVSPSERFKCYHCSSISASLHTYQMHLERHGEKNHLCSECGKGFTTRDYLRQHVGLMHDTVAGARLRAKYKRSREKKKGQQVKESKSTVEATSTESNMEF